MFDLYRISAQRLKLKKWGLMVGDTLFWLLLTPIVFLLLLWGNWAEVRFYVLFGLVFGAVVYLKLFSDAMLPLIGRLFNSIGWLIGSLIALLVWIWKIICWPFRGAYLAVIFPVGLVIKVGGKLWRAAKGLWIRSVQKIKLWIKPNKPKE